MGLELAAIEADPFLRDELEDHAVIAFEAGDEAFDAFPADRFGLLGEDLSGKRGVEPVGMGCRRRVYGCERPGRQRPFAGECQDDAALRAGSQCEDAFALCRSRLATELSLALLHLLCATYRV